MTINELLLGVESLNYYNDAKTESTIDNVLKCNNILLDYLLFTQSIDKLTFPKELRYSFNNIFYKLSQISGSVFDTIIVDSELTGNDVNNFCAGLFQTFLEEYGDFEIDEYIKNKYFRYFKWNNIEIENYLTDSTFTDIKTFKIPYSSRINKNGTTYSDSTFDQLTIDLFNEYNVSWSRIYLTLMDEYNPLWNYDGSDSETRTITSTSNNKVNSKIVTSGQNQNISKIAGYNTETPKTSTTDDVSTSSQVAGDKNDNYSEGTNTSTETLTRIKGGNQGVTTSQAMAIEELNLRMKYKLFPIIFNDIYNYLGRDFYTI